MTLTPIEVPFPDAEQLTLRLAVGACRLTVRPADGDAWVTGKYDDPSGEIPVSISTTGGEVRISQKPTPTGWIGITSGVPTFELGLGRARPYELRLETGASEDDLDLGGLPLTRLALRHGAGKLEVRFSDTNPQEMDTLQIGVGAGSTGISGLANANAAEVSAEGGAAGLILDLGGPLRRACHLRVSTGLSSVELRVPEDVAAEIRLSSMLGGRTIPDGFAYEGGVYRNRPARDGAEPLLTVDANVAIGSFNLHVT